MGYFIWKVFSVPYHILIHDKTLLGAIDALSSHLYGAGGVQNMAIWGVKTGLLWRAHYGSRTQPGNRIMRHITSHYMATDGLGPLLTYPCTFMAQWGQKDGYFGG